MKKISIIAFLLIFSCFIVGCSNDNNTTENKTPIESNGQEIDTTEMKQKHCTGQAKAGSGIQVELSYDLYHTGDVLNILHSESKVISSSDESLDTYENAYKKIHENYEGLKYYDTRVERGDTTVTNYITINYDEIDIEQLLRIEGNEDNIIKDGKASVDEWLKLAKKFGTTCEDVE